MWSLKNEALKTSTIWFDKIKHDLLKLGLDSQIMSVNSGFEKLLELSSRENQSLG